RETHGAEYFYCTDPDASVAAILEAYADRAALEEVFHDVKEVWGSGQQQVRKLWSNVAVWHLNLWMQTLTELWAWRRWARRWVQGQDSLWDRPPRRPSQADRCKALQAACLVQAFRGGKVRGAIPRKCRTLLHRLLRIAV